MAPKVGVVSGVSGVRGRIAGVLCAGRGRDFRRRRKCGSSGCRVVEDASGLSPYPVSLRRSLAPCGWEATVAAHGPAALGGGLGGGVIGECRAAMFLPGRAAPVKQSAASPWGRGMLVWPGHSAPPEALPRTSLSPSVPARPPLRAPALPLVRVVEDALSPAAVPGVAVGVGDGCLSREDRTPLHAWHGQVR